jgi:hypothetical protein
MYQPDFPTAISETAKAWAQLTDQERIEETRELSPAETLHGGLAFTSLLIHGSIALGYAIQALAPQPAPAASPVRQPTADEVQALLHAAYRGH